MPQAKLSRPVLSEAPTLSSRGQRSLVRPPLLRCSLFNCQYNACLNQSGLLNLGVAENVRTEGPGAKRRPRRFSHVKADSGCRARTHPRGHPHRPQSLCLDWLTEFFQSHFSLDYTDFTVSLTESRMSLVGPRSDKLIFSLRAL